MKLYSWLSLGLISCAFLSLFLIFFTLFLHRKHKIELVSIKKSKKKKKSKKHQRQLTKKEQGMTRVIKKGRLKIFFFMIVMVLSVSGAYFSKNYLTSHLTVDDSEAIVKGYYLLEDAEKQLKAIENSDNPGKIRNNIREDAAKLAGFGVQFASANLTVERQQLLNRYYQKLKELGLNLANETLSNTENADIYNFYISDVEKLKKEQTRLFKEFDINEVALKSKK